MLSFLELARARYSCRAFQQRQVEEGKLARVIEAARLGVVLRMDHGAPVNARIRGAEHAREAAATLDLESMARLIGPTSTEGEDTSLASQ